MECRIILLFLPNYAVLASHEASDDRGAFHHKASDDIGAFIDEAYDVRGAFIDEACGSHGMNNLYLLTEWIIKRL